MARRRQRRSTPNRPESPQLSVVEAEVQTPADPPPTAATVAEQPVEDLLRLPPPELLLALVQFNNERTPEMVRIVEQARMIEIQALLEELLSYQVQLAHLLDYICYSGFADRTA